MAPLYEYQNTPGLRFYNTPDEFIAAIEDALRHDAAADRQLRQSAVRQCTWDIRTQELGGLIAARLSGAEIPQAASLREA
jgi:hypothetical protein